MSRRRNSHPRTKARHRSREGIALVIVLGFLVVLTIMAMSFAITMRVERLSSNTYYHGARARHLVHVGLARALAHVDGEMVANDQYYPDGDTTPANYIYRSPASDPQALTTSPSRALLADGQQAVQYLPRPLPASRNANWIVIRENPADANSRVMGRFAYIAVDCSGLLDANTAGGAAARLVGVDPGEVRLNPQLLPELNSQGRVDQFISLRGSPWRRFETMAELGSVGPDAIGGDLQRLFPYSLFPAGYFDATAGQARASVYIGGNAADINWTDVLQQLTDMGVPDPAALRNNLQYYLGYQVDRTAAKLDSFATERIPMINELVIETELEALAESIRLTIQVRAELWYPFVGSDANTNSYSLQLAPELVGGSFSQPSAQVQAAAGPWNPGAGGSGQFHVLEFTFVSEASTVGPGGPVVPAMPTGLRFNASNLHQGVGAGGPIVDRIRTPFTITPWGTHFVNPGDGPGARVGSRWEVVDPRLNWDWNAPTQWQPAVESRSSNMATLRGNLSQINGRATTSMNAAGNDGTWHMYVRGAGNLEAAGELGFLLYDAGLPWRTIPLLGPDRLPVLDRFTTSNEPYRRGLVNINSPEPDVLAAAFLDMRIERFPGDPSGSVLNVASAQSLANAVIDAGPFVNLADIGAANIAGALGGSPTPLEAKSALRNSANLLSARQNLLTVVVAAQSILVPDDWDGSESAANIMGESRALFVVWRDPYDMTVDGDLLNRSFVRFFRWLDE